MQTEKGMVEGGMGVEATGQVWGWGGARTPFHPAASKAAGKRVQNKVEHYRNCLCCSMA